jgi:molybdate transport system ATP-binding protein/molybdate/tungstate transport system ATP-binding protein
MVLLLDEPLSALDPGLRERLQMELKKLHSTLHLTTLHVTHSFDEAVSLADRLAVINKGEILQIGTPQEVFRYPASEFVARFVGVENLFRGYLTKENGKGFETGKISIQVITQKEGDAVVSIRPEEITLSEEPMHLEDVNCLRGKIVDIIDKGSFYKVFVDAGETFVALVPNQLARKMNIIKGGKIHVVFKISAVHVL